MHLRLAAHYHQHQGILTSPEQVLKLQQASECPGGLVKTSRAAPQFRIPCGAPEFAFQTSSPVMPLTCGARTELHGLTTQAGCGARPSPGGGREPG